jgi:hypothetical protein
MAILSIYLRQRGSSQSKPVGAAHTATGIEGWAGYATVVGHFQVGVGHRGMTREGRSVSGDYHPPATRLTEPLGQLGSANWTCC